MILISAGTVHYPFRRLIETSFDYFSSKQNLSEKLIIQSGELSLSSTNDQIVVKPYYTLPEMIAFYQQSSLIVSAAGEASTHLMLHYSNYQPILFPRDPLKKEHVDAQQLQIAKTLTTKKMVKLVDSEAELLEMFDRYLTHKWSPPKVDRRMMNKETSKVVHLLDQITGE